MTPREKALLFVELFWTEVEDNEYETRKMSFNQAKQCSLIAVDEIINLDDFSVDGREYWYQVKQEIEKL